MGKTISTIEIMPVEDHGFILAIRFKEIKHANETYAFESMWSLLPALKQILGAT